MTWFSEEDKLELERKRVRTRLQQALLDLETVIKANPSTCLTYCQDNWYCELYKNVKRNIDNTERR